MSLIDTSFRRTMEGRVVQVPQDYKQPPRAQAIISYAHESDEHVRRVRELADRLRHDGVECALDQYLVAPDAGWPNWISAL